MNKKIMLITAAVVIAVGGGVAYLLMRDGASEDMIANTSETTQPTDTNNSQPAAPAEEVPAETAQAGSYVEYSEKALNDAEGTKIIFFHASWCPQCRALEADINESGVPDGVTIFKADYDSSTALKQKYGVTIQTTLVKVGDNGELVKKYVAYDNPTLQSVEDNLL